MSRIFFDFIENGDFVLIPESKTIVEKIVYSRIPMLISMRTALIAVDFPIENIPKDEFNER
jgi:hypothetical protein